MLFDQRFCVRQVAARIIRVQNAHRIIHLKAKSRDSASEWLTHFKMIAQNQAIDYTVPHEHMSYAPVRRAIQAAPLIDGCAYMNAVANAMEVAREEIYIADWWLSPMLHLKRPFAHNAFWRLDEVLRRKASNGVHIFILIYNDVNMALHLNSEDVIKELKNIHDNIKVMWYSSHFRTLHFGQLFFTIIL